MGGSQGSSRTSSGGRTSGGGRRGSEGGKRLGVGDGGDGVRRKSFSVRVADGNEVAGLGSGRRVEGWWSGGADRRMNGTFSFF